MADSPEAMKKHIRIYIGVFIALLVGTTLTVAVARFGSWGIGTAIGVALLIATVKGSLVASFFMHLIGEKKVILWILVLTLALFLPLMLLPVMTSEMQAEGIVTNVAPYPDTGDGHDEEADSEH